LLCGEILDPGTYRQLESKSGCRPTSYFPSYRAPGSPFSPD